MPLTPGPAGRLLGAVVAVVGLATVPLHFPAARYGVAVAAMVALGVLRPPFRALFRRGIFAVPMIAGLVLPLALGGSTEQAARLAVRALCSLLTVLAFTGRLTNTQLPQALVALHLPAALTSIIATLVRQLSAIRAQGQRIVLSRKLRGATGSVVNSEVLACLIASTARRADRVQLAMRLRGADPTASGTTSLQRRDLPLLAFGGFIGLIPHLMVWLPQSWI